MRVLFLGESTLAEVLCRDPDITWSSALATGYRLSPASV